MIKVNITATISTTKPLQREPTRVIIANKYTQCIKACHNMPCNHFCCSHLTMEGGGGGGGEVGGSRPDMGFTDASKAGRRGSLRVHPSVRLTCTTRSTEPHLPKPHLLASVKRTSGSQINFLAESGTVMLICCSARARLWNVLFASAPLLFQRVPLSSHRLPSNTHWLPLYNSRYHYPYHKSLTG